MNALQASRMYDSFPPGQTMTREAFIKRAVVLTEPDAYHRDAQAILERRSTAQAEKVKIERAMT